MSETAVENILAHYGKKGMKWGVRNQKIQVSDGNTDAHIRISNRTGKATVSNQTSALIAIPAVPFLPLAGFAFLRPRVRAEWQAATKVNKDRKVDNKWKKKVNSAKKAVEVHNKAADEINAKLPGFNNDKRWKGVNLNTNPAKLAAYNKAAEREILNPAYSNAALKIHGAQSPSGRYKFEIKDPSTAKVTVRDTGIQLWTPKKKTIKHADDSDELSVQFKILRDEDGLILGFELEDDAEMAQSADDVDDVDHIVALGAEFLEHVGVKGMRWGVRKAPPPMAVSPKARSLVRRPDRRKTKIKTEGGQNHPASEDAIKVAEAHAKLRKSGLPALSNKELQEVQTRLNLERNVKQLVGARSRIGKGRNFAKSVTGFGKDFNDAVNTGANTNRLVRG